MIKKALPSQIDKIIAITKACAIDMQQKRIFQWNEHYPSKKAFINDCQRGELYVYLMNDEIIGCITISTYKDAKYDETHWLTEEKTHYYIHRLAVDPLHQGKGIAQQLMSYAEEKALSNQVTSVRLDTFSENERNVHFYETRGYKKKERFIFPNKAKLLFIATN